MGERQSESAQDWPDTRSASADGGVPDWFRQALSEEPPARYLEVEGAPIEYRTWGSPEKPGILLLHGGRAHARWWSHIAPFLAADARVVALSFSGMGQSGWRDFYSTAQYAREVESVAQEAGLFSKGAPAIVAHSFGAAAAAHALADGWPSAAVIIDSGVDWHSGGPLRKTARDERQVFSAVTDALPRYRLTPPQHCANQFLIDWVARSALQEVPGGYAWSFDPRLLSRLEPGETRALLRTTTRPLAFVTGDRSVITTLEVITALKEQFPTAPFVEIPECGHHVLFDQPLALVSVLRSVLPALLQRTHGS